MDGGVEKLEKELVSMAAAVASEAVLRHTSSSWTAFSFLTVCVLLVRCDTLILCILIAPLYPRLLLGSSEGGKPMRTAAASSMSMFSSVARSSGGGVSFVESRDSKEVSEK